MGLRPTILLSRSPSLALLLLWLLSAASLLHHYPCSGSSISGRIPASSADGLHKTFGDSTVEAIMPSDQRIWPTGSMSGRARRLGGTKPSKGSTTGSSSTGNGSGVINVMDFGAKGDGSTDDSKAFASAWAAACTSAAPIELLVQEGKSFRLPPMTFSGPCKSDVTLSIKGTIVGSPNKSDWVGKDLKRWLTFAGINNLKVRGGGTFNGNGPIWWKNSCKVDKSLKCTDAPTAVTFSSCTNLEVNDIRFKDSQKMHVTFGSCLCPGEQKSAVAISGVTYRNITGISATSVALELDCSKSVPCRDIVLHDINLAMVGGGATKSFITNAYVSKLGTIVPPVGA